MDGNGKRNRGIPRKAGQSPSSPTTGGIGGSREDSHVLEEESKAQYLVPGVLLIPGCTCHMSLKLPGGEWWAATQATVTMALRPAVSLPLNWWLTPGCPQSVPSSLGAFQAYILQARCASTGCEFLHGEQVGGNYSSRSQA